MEHWRIGFIQGVYKQPMWDVRWGEGKAGDGGDGFTTAEATTVIDWLMIYGERIRSVAFWTNASPIPVEILDEVAKMKGIIGANKCL